MYVCGKKEVKSNTKDQNNPYPLKTQTNIKHKTPNVTKLHSVSWSLLVLYDVGILEATVALPILYMIYSVYCTL